MAKNCLELGFDAASLKFPEDNMVLGCNRRQAINIGSAIARKILKGKGQTVIQLTVHSFTPDELKSEDHKSK
jgi:hypothetical protein